MFEIKYGQPVLDEGRKIFNFITFSIFSSRFSDTENKGYDSTSKIRRVILERFDATDLSESSLKALQGYK